MKRSLSTAVAALLVSGSIFAGGIVTNTNQSAMFTRMGNRAATVGIDAVYYNPAGLTQLGTGLHLSINNQTIGQTRTVITDYAPVLNYRYPSNGGEFIGEVSAPLFPGVYAAFKMGNWAFSAGFNPVGGGGGATYNSGLPSFEYPVSDLVPAIGSPSITNYRMNAFFKGKSVFYGIQANVSYAINDKISVALGGRYVIARETYSGYVKDIQIGDGTDWQTPPAFFTGVATSATNADNGIQQAIDNTPVTENTPIEALGNQDLIDGLIAVGQYTPGMTCAQSQAVYQGVAATATSQAQATGFLLADQELEATKEATGITPIVSINVQPVEMLNIAVKYEFATKLEFTTSSPAGKGGLIGVDGSDNPIYMFNDGAKDRLDMPALLAVGATLRPIKRLLVAGSFTTYFDKNAVWGTEDANRTMYLDKNSYDIGLGAEFSLTKKWLVSAGWSMSATGATEEYQSDLSYSLGTQGISFGLAWDILPILQLNLGGQLVSYSDDQRTFDHDFAGSGAMLPITEQLQKSVWVFGAGVNVTLAKKGE